MSVIRTLSLDVIQRDNYVSKIKERVVSRLNFEPDFGQIAATEVDFSVLNRRAVTKMSDSIGQQFTIPVPVTMQQSTNIMDKKGTLFRTTV